MKYSLNNRRKKVCPFHSIGKKQQKMKESMKSKSLPQLSTVSSFIALFKVNNENTRTMYEICSQLTINTPERHRNRCIYFSGASIVDFEQVTTGRGRLFYSVSLSY